MKKALLYSLAAVALVSCSSDDQGESDTAFQDARITAGVTGAATRANGSAWEADHIGIIVTSAPNSTMDDTYTNVEYETSATTATSADFTAVSQKIFFQDATETVTFAAYAPYSSNITETNGERLISASTENQQSSTDPTDRTEQKKIDFIHASGVTASNSSPVVSFNSTTGHPFAHKMTRLVLVMKTDATSGFTATDVTTGTYTLEGITHDGTFNVLTGEAKATVPGSSTVGSTPWSLTDNALKEVSSDNTSITFTSILFPQSVSSLTLNATIGGQTYKATLTPALASGMSYTYTVTMKKQGLTVSGCTIDNWGDGNGASGEEISGKIPVTYNVSNLTSGSTITLSAGSTVTLSGASSSSSNAKTRAANATPLDLTLVFEGSAKLILDNVALGGANTRIVVEHGTANIILKGENSIILSQPAPMAKPRYASASTHSTADYSNCGPISLLNEDAHVIIDGEDRTNSLTITNGYDLTFIGGVTDSKAGNITIKNATIDFNVDNTYSSVIGCGWSENSGASCGNIEILNSKITFNVLNGWSEYAFIGTSSLCGEGAECSCGNIVIKETSILSNFTTSFSYAGAIVGTGYNTGSHATTICGDITIVNTSFDKTIAEGKSLGKYNTALIGLGRLGSQSGKCGNISFVYDDTSLTYDQFAAKLINGINDEIESGSYGDYNGIGFGVNFTSALRCSHGKITWNGEEMEKEHILDLGEMG